MRVEADLAGQSAAGPLAWTGTCIWEKQAAKRGQGHGHSECSGNRRTAECGVSGGPENTFRCTLGGVRAREGTKIMNEKESGEEMEGMGQQTCCVRSQLGQPETMQSSNSVSAREATNAECGRQGATHRRSA